MRMFEYNTTATTRILGLPPYSFFSLIGFIFAAALFIILLRKRGFSIPRYMLIAALSVGGLFAGGRLFGILSGVYLLALNGQRVTSWVIFHTGIVFYGGLFGFILVFILVSKIWLKRIDPGSLDLVAVCIPLFHAWARVGCFTAGCCYGKATDSWFSVLYTNRIRGTVMTVSRIPVQLMETMFNIAIFTVLIILLSKKMLKEHLLIAYLILYPAARIVSELFRGDAIRGVWHGISFSQSVSVITVAVCIAIITRKKVKPVPPS